MTRLVRAVCISLSPSLFPLAGREPGTERGSAGQVVARTGKLLLLPRSRRSLCEESSAARRAYGGLPAPDQREKVSASYYMIVRARGFSGDPGGLGRALRVTEV